MNKFKEYALVSLKRSLVEGQDFYSDHVGIELPAGTQGVVLELINENLLYVEFRHNGKTEYVTVLAKEVDLVLNQ